MRSFRPKDARMITAEVVSHVLRRGHERLERHLPFLWQYQCSRDNTICKYVRDLNENECHEAEVDGQRQNVSFSEKSI